MVNGADIAAALQDAVMSETRPSTERVAALRDQYTLYYKNFHEACAKADTYFLSENTVEVPEGGPKVYPIVAGTAHAIVNVATDHVDVNNVSIDVPASTRLRDRAEKIKRVLQGIWAQVDPAIKRTLVRHEFLYGVGVLKIMWAPDQWPQAPRMEDFGDIDSDSFDGQGYKDALREFLDARRMAFPFAAYNVNPKNLLWDDSRTGPHWAIERYTSTADDVRAKYPQWEGGQAGAEAVDWTEYWDEEWYGYLVGNEWVEGPHRHGYGGLPYVLASPASGPDLRDGPPERRYRSILAPVYSLIDTEARLLTAYEAITRNYGWPSLDFTGQNTMAVDNTIEYYSTWGKMNKLLPGVTVVASPKMTPPQELLQQLSVVQNMIEMATFPNVVRGQRPSGLSAGFALSVMAGMGRLVFQGVADGAARAIRQANQGFLRLIRDVAGGPVTVYARTEAHQFEQRIEPDEVTILENVVSLKAEAPEERERESLLAFRLWNSGQGLISLYEAQRRIGIPNPLEEQQLMAAEQLLGLLRPEQAQQLLQELTGATATPLSEESTGALGTEFLPGQAQLQRPGERNVQQARSASQAGRPSVFPQGLAGMDLLAQRLGGQPGGRAGMPSGQTI